MDVESCFICDKKAVGDDAEGGVLSEDDLVEVLDDCIAAARGRKAFGSV